MNLLNEDYMRTLLIISWELNALILLGVEIFSSSISKKKSTAVERQ